MCDIFFWNSEKVEFLLQISFISGLIRKWTNESRDLTS